MRTRRIVLLALGLLLAQAAPAGAQVSAPFFGLTFTISPVGGTPGTSIRVDGQCFGANEGDTYLDIPPTSDFVVVADSEHFTVSGNRFSATLNNPFGTSSEGFPVDARVRVQCGLASASRPFHASSTPTGSSPSIFTSLGAKPHVKGFNANGALAGTNFYPEGDNSRGPSIAVGDVTGVGRVDIVTGSGHGSTGVVRVSSLTGELLAARAVYPPEFTGGVNVAVGDVTGDGRNDVITGAGPGGGPHVLVLSYNAAAQSFDIVGSFFAYDPRFAGGVNVAVGAGPEIITGAGPGGGPNVRRFDNTGRMRWEFMAYATNFAGGVSVAYDVTAGSIVTGAGTGGGPHVMVFDVTGFPRASFYAYDPAFSGGVSVATGRVNGAPQIVTGAGPGGSPHVRIFNTNGSLKSGGFYAYGPFTAGVRVAVAP
jgi:hypothetical protein